MWSALATRDGSCFNLAGSGTGLDLDDVARKKPHPDGLIKILGERAPEIALYVGDNVDDALAARAAGVRFIGILPKGTHGYSERLARFKDLSALGVIPKATDVNDFL